ncbi:MAG: hypothetical protein OEX82_03125 [Nitrosomonas sp.]|nr:hypothetical protein [Nitrosomonas sp.]
MSHPEKEEDLGSKLLLPAALLLVLLFVPFSINYFMHVISADKQRSVPLAMKLPVDNSAIVVPKEVKQYEGFEVSLRIDTTRLAGLINEVQRISTGGANIQGISGAISPEMKAEITGENFSINNEGPQEQLYLLDGKTHWTWHVTPESSGRNLLKFHLHLLSYDDGKTEPMVVDVADVNIVAIPNPSVWMARNWGWAAAFLILAIVGWRLLANYLNNRQAADN